ncbi:RagB/SusD family nutrient uptake outer membrane protein [Marivirga sp.]|uniref:RagB/SusD family nutrient uptake outer membrane protein n=1 Tax=Marivirga sp. TaxID=2018662 RepID=UPI002D8002F5|nr:RagB/SusD family nutrient uptake outer membrane protein [Marivirga sp.]HET8859551.1 RagB/SusD family nutrient uptake outer membrane protein [Marivirga sp.]
MKTYKIYSLIGMLIILSIFGCEDDFLDRQPQATLVAGNFPATGEEAVIATNGIYNTLRIWGIYSGGFPLIDIMTDEMVKGSNPGDGVQVLNFQNYTFTADDGNIETWYRTLYLGIRRSYLVLEKVPEIEMDAQLQNRLLGEARFLRSFFYFSLVQAFGDVPFVESSEAPDGLERTNKETIYQEVIIPDLLFAIDNLPEKSEYANEDAGRITRGAARAMLARIYLFRGDFQNAATYALEVINSQQYELEDEFQMAFRVATEHGQESVFEIGAIPEGNFALGGNQYANTQGVRGTPNWGWGFGRPSYPWIEKLNNNNDPRLEGSVIFLGDTIDGVLIQGDGTTPDTTYAEDGSILQIETYNRKVYATGERSADRWGHNRRVIRYADVLLMAAEALNETGRSAEALTYLNEVRQRARGDVDGILPDITTTDPDQLREIIYEERTRELAFEGLRYWDLIRTNRAEEILGPLGFEAGKHELFPIPQSEINISGGNISQNPNWN